MSVASNAVKMTTVSLQGLIVNGTVEYIVLVNLAIFMDFTNLARLEAV